MRGRRISMSGRPRRYRVYALVMAASLILVGYAGMNAVGASSPTTVRASSPGVPRSLLEGKHVAFVACSDLNRWCREFRKVLVSGLKAEGVIVTDLQDPYDPVLQEHHLLEAVAEHPTLIALLATNATSVIPGLARRRPPVSRW